MVRKQIVLTPSESKKLIARAVCATEPVQRALKSGLLVIHPGSTTYFIAEHLMGHPPADIWMIGMIVPKGACVEGLTQREFERQDYRELRDPGDFPYSWVFRQGTLETGVRLEDLLSDMGSDDVYIKGVNAVDTHGCVGVLVGSLAGGTIGRVVAYQKSRKFHAVYVGGLEKLVPGSLRHVAAETGRKKTSDAMGIPIGLYPIEARPITEVEAFNILAGVEAIPVAAGGVGGAEGSILLVIKGTETEVNKAMDLARMAKGAQLPAVRIPDCQTCHSPNCYFSRAMH